MRRRLAAAAMVLLAAVAALAWRGAGDPPGSSSLAGLLPVAPPTVTHRAPTPENVPAVDLPAGRPIGVQSLAPVVESTPQTVQLSAAPPERPLYPGQPRQLTQDACCSGAWWADDGSALYVLDQPPGAAQTAIYRLPLWPPGALPEVLDTRQLAGQERYLVSPAGDHSLVEDRETGQSWQLPTGGSPARVSADGSRVVWWDMAGGRDRDTHLTHIYGAHIDGSGLKELGALWGAEVVAFLPDNRRVLVKGRPVVDRAVSVLATLDVETGELVSIARGPWLSDAALAPDGQHVAYVTSLDREDVAANGVWVAAVDGGEPKKLPFEGAYRWRDGDRLVYVPMQPGAASDSVWQYRVSTGTTEPLLDPADIELRIANNDWSIAPDGFTMAWLAEDDRNLWLVDLP
jgi:hypothetical protein